MNGGLLSSRTGLCTVVWAPASAVLEIMVGADPLPSSSAGLWSDALSICGVVGRPAFNPAAPTVGEPRTGMFDRLLRTMGLSYTSRHHLRQRARQTDWLFLAAVLAMIVAAVFVLVKLA